MANKANLANSVLFAPLSDTDTELEVYTGDGALFPAAPFYLTLSPKNKWSRKINSEIVLVTAKSTDTFTITRAQKGTTAREFSYGDLVANGIYVEDLDDTVDTAVAAALEAMMPVGFVVTLGVSTSPADLYGFGTWTRIQGRVVVGVSDSDTDFDLNDTGGAKTHTLSISEIPSHRHVVRGDLRSDSIGIKYGVNGSGNMNMTPSSDGANSSTYTGLLYGWYVGGDSPHNIMQPYIAKYVWERTA